MGFLSSLDQCFDKKNVQNFLFSKVFWRLLDHDFSKYYHKNLYLSYKKVSSTFGFIYFFHFSSFYQPPKTPCQLSNSVVGNRIFEKQQGS